LAGEGRGARGPGCRRQPANPTPSPGYPEGRLQVDRLGSNNLAPLLVGGQINPALAANRIAVLKDTHGKTSQLGADDIEALSLYLLSLQ
jgi:hypothetical protein